MSCDPKGNPISGAIINFLSSNSKRSNEDWPIAPSIDNQIQHSLDTIGSKFIPILAISNPRRRTTQADVSNKNEIIVSKPPNNAQIIPLSENSDNNNLRNNIIYNKNDNSSINDTNYTRNESNNDIKNYPKVERCAPTTGSMGFGELLREMIDSVAELLKSLLTLNFNSTLAEITGVVFCGNRFLYLLLLIVMFMFLRRLLVALFLF